MAWVRIEDAVTEHRKHLKAGPAACWLWICAIAYCQRQLSDGFIPEEAVPMLGVTKGSAPLVQRLLEVGLLDQAEGGYRVHDYHDYNESRVEALHRRSEKHAAKAKAGRAGAAARWQTDSRQMADGNSRPMAPSHPIPSPPDPSVSPRARSGGVLAGQLPRDHMRHAFCGRKCVPEFLHGEFLQAFGGDRPAAEARLLGWYAQVDAGLPDGPIGDDPVKFWRAHFATAWPSGAPKTSEKTDPKSNVPSAEETRRRYLGGDR